MRFKDYFRRPFAGSGTVARHAQNSVSLALQGGGSFGAFTWGVLDRLLEEETLKFDAISGTSAGAVNAVLLASGLAENGRAGAREALERFWRGMSKASSFLSITAVPAAVGALARILAPAQFNPFDLNPLRSTLVDQVDFERIRTRSPIRLLIAATRISDGSLRIFRNHELSVDAVLASACLPLIHNTIEIDGEGYWDGGYVANPPLIDLAQESDARDLLIVQITPNRSTRTPITKREIERRLLQIVFNTPLSIELEAIKLASALGDEKFAALRVERIVAEEDVDDLSERHAADLGWPFLERLRDAGREAAGRWLAARHAAALGG